MGSKTQVSIERSKGNSDESALKTLGLVLWFTTRANSASHGTQFGNI